MGRVANKLLEEGECNSQENSMSPPQISNSIGQTTESSAGITELAIVMRGANQVHSLDTTHSNSSEFSSEAGGEINPGLAKTDSEVHKLQGELIHAESNARELHQVEQSGDDNSQREVTPEVTVCSSPHSPGDTSSEFELAVANAERREVNWYLNFEQFVSGIQQEPDLCQFFAEQNTIDLTGTNVDPVLNPYTRTILATSNTTQ